MFIKDILKLSAINAFRAKTRSFLTMLSITIGIASVILVSTIGSNGEKLITGELEKLGLEGISIYKTESDSKTVLLDSDIEKLKRRFSEIEEAIPIVLDIGIYKMNRNSGNAVFFGVGESPASVYDITLLHGKIPSKSDIRTKKRVAVVDDELAKKIYHRTNIVGKKIVIEINGNREEIEVFGVIKSQKDGINNMFGNNIPDFIYMPYTTLNDIRKINEISQIAVISSDKTSDGAHFANYLNKIKGEKAYSAENVSTKISEIKSITGLVSIIITTIAGIALCVAGVGIMNSTFSACRERRKEIGICMAIGAGFRDILFCFLFESIIISLLGGLCGAIIGALCCLTVSNIFNIVFKINLMTLIIAEAVSVLFGIIFSIIPAIKAAKLDPIQAFRQE